MPFYVLDFFNSFSNIFSALFIAAGVILLAAGLRRFEKQQRNVSTAELLSKYYRNLHLPHEAMGGISADQFALGARAQSNEQYHHYKTILDYLNEMEFVAVLVNTNVVDERLAAKLMRNSVVRAYKSLIEYIMKARADTGIASLYTELEALAHRWGSSRDF